MAQIEFNDETGLFESTVGDENVDDVVTSQEAVEVLEDYEESQEVQEDVEDTQDILDGMELAPLPDQEEAPTDSDVVLDDYFIVPYSAAPSDTSFSPQNWQINLAAGRSLGEHYLMYGIRSSSGSYYWHYYLVIGDDISYENDSYIYSDCDVYSYYSANNVVHYDRETGSGVISGAEQVVYSDLYFDYVGSDPASSATPYLIYVLLFVIILLLMIRRKA